MKANVRVYFMDLKYCFEKRYIVIKKIPYWFATKNILGVFFWAPIATNRYNIESGYDPGNKWL